MAFEAGITLFDPAENYLTPTGPNAQAARKKYSGAGISHGASATRWLWCHQGRRPGNAAGDMTHIRGEDRCFDRANIVQAVDDSLRRSARTVSTSTSCTGPSGRSRRCGVRAIPTCLTIRS
ncbi:MAG: hypothetical protein R3E09_00480 [Novosphingobium sp.]